MEKEARKFLNPQGEKLVEILQASDEEIEIAELKRERDELLKRNLIISSLLSQALDFMDPFTDPWHPKAVAKFIKAANAEL